MILKKNAIVCISEKLNLPFTGVEQDWAIEFSNPEKLKDFIILYKSDNTLSREDKLALMSLILASFDEKIEVSGIDKHQWKDIANLLNEDIFLFKDLIDYWTLKGEENHDIFFNITPLIRKLKS